MIFKRFNEDMVFDEDPTPHPDPLPTSLVDPLANQLRYSLQKETERACAKTPKVIPK